jgi:hypothetical protein
MQYTIKKVLNKLPNGKITVADTKVQLIPCKVYGEKPVLNLISSKPESHIPNFKIVMGGFDVEIVSKFIHSFHTQ